RIWPTRDSASSCSLDVRPPWRQRQRELKREKGKGKREKAKAKGKGKRPTAKREDLLRRCFQQPPFSCTRCLLNRRRAMLAMGTRARRKSTRRFPPAAGPGW